MTGRWLRFVLFVASGLALFGAVALFFAADWTCLHDGRAAGFMDCQRGDPIVGDGLGGRIGIEGVTAIGAVALLGLVGAWLAELLVRRRTRMRLTRGESGSRRP